jgi:type I restriction enzyme S subunit
MSQATIHIETEKQPAPALRFKEFDENIAQHLFENIFLFSSGKNIKQAEASPEFEIPCVRYGELYHMYGEVINQVINRTNLDASELLFSKGDEILLPSAGEDPLDIGSASALTLENVAIGRTINILRPLEDNIYSQIFASYYINEKLRKKISTLARGASISNVYNSDLKKLKINLPSLPEQQKIASFLSAVDEKIQQLTKKKKLLEQYKKGVMQELFSGQLRFKDENANPYPEWKEKKISQVVTEVNERTIENNQFEVLSSTKSGIVLQSEYFNKQVASSDSSNYKIVRKGMFSYRSMSDTGSFTFNIQNVIEIGIVSPAYPVFRVNENQSAFYLYLTLNNSSHFKSQLLAMMEGGTRLALGFSKFKKMIVHLPSFEEQQKIATYLSRVDTKIEAVSNQITQTQTFKKGLMQQMFV